MSSNSFRSDSSSHSLQRYVVVIARTSGLSVSKNLFFIQCFSFQGLNVSVACLKYPSGTSPRMDSSMTSKSASLLTSYASSIHSQHSVPVLTAMDVIFKGSSRPRKYIFCPVGRYSASRGLFLNRQNASTPRRLTAHCKSV